MARSLPPLNALRALEAAARHGSFKRAAEELHVTPAAISQHIKTLEALYDVPLFIRTPRALKVTEAGKAALQPLSAGLDQLQRAADRLQSYANAGLLTISVSPSFGSMWLVPRLDQFYALHPDIEIRLDGTDRLVDVARGEADLAIRYGPGGYGGVHVDLLFNQVNTPVCSPALLRGPVPLRTPADLARHTLLHVDWKGSDASWRMWLRAAGQDQIDPTRGQHFTQESMAVQAAIDGQGVALIGDRLITDHIENGALVCPFDQTLRTPLAFSYHLLAPENHDEKPRVRAFRDWLLHEVGQTSAR